MDQRTRDVEEDVKDILRTRLALAEKIQLLERRVEETVEGTKSAALDVIDHARNSAVGFAEAAAHGLNPTVQAGRRPWMLVGSAIAIGFLAGLMGQRRKSGGVYARYPPKTKGADVMPSHGNGQTEDRVQPFYSTESDGTETAGSGRATATLASGVIRQAASLWGDLSKELANERRRIQEAALEAGRSLVHDAARIVVQSLAESLKRQGLNRPEISRSTHGRTSSKS